jgi:hypothetical protein
MSRLRQLDAFSSVILNVMSAKIRGACRISGWNATGGGVVLELIATVKY